MPGKDFGKAEGPLQHGVDLALVPIETIGDRCQDNGIALRVCLVMAFGTLNLANAGCDIQTERRRGRGWWR